MNNETRDRLIADLLADGKSLSDIQKILKADHDLQLTYMDLRLISSELDVDWKKLEPEKPKDTMNVIDSNASDADDGGLPQSGTVVNVSKVVRPGAVVSGDVTFNSGARAEWYLDSLGRLGLNPTGSSEKPTEDDLQKFQLELQKALQGKF